MKGGLAVMLELARTVRRAGGRRHLRLLRRARRSRPSTAASASCFEERPDLLAGDVALLGEPTDGGIEAGCQGTMRLRVTLRGGAGPHRPAVDGPQRHPPARPALLAALDGLRGAPPGDRRAASTARRCRPSGSRAAWPATWCPTRSSCCVNHRFAPDRDAGRGRGPRARAARARGSSDGDDASRSSTSAAGAAPGARPSAARRAHRPQRARGAGQARLDRRRPLRQRAASRPPTSAPATRRSPTPRTSASTASRLERTYLALADLLRTRRPPRGSIARARHGRPPAVDGCRQSRRSTVTTLP